MCRIYKLNCVVMIIALVLFGRTSAFAEIEWKIYVNDEIISSELKPKMVGDILYIPIRPVYEAMGAKISWDKDEGNILISKENVKVIMNTGEYIYYVSYDDKPFEERKTYAAISAIDKEVYAPAIYLAEAAGYTQRIDKNNGTIIFEPPTDYEGINKSFADRDEPINVSYPILINAKVKDRKIYYPLQLKFMNDEYKYSTFNGTLNIEIVNDLGKNIFGGVLKFKKSDFIFDGENWYLNLSFSQDKIKKGLSSCGDFYMKLSFSGKEKYNLECRINGLPE